MAENADNLALEILEKVCETDEIAEDPEMDLFDAGLIDSLSTISIILEIENKTGIKLQPTDIEKEDIISLAAFRKFLAAKLKK